MFCSACGQAIDAYQPFCPRCGRQVTPIATATPPPWLWTRVHQHVHTLGILWIVYAGMSLLLWMMMVPFMAGMFHLQDFPMRHGFGGFNFPLDHFPFLIPIITAAVLVRSVLCVVTGIALLQRRSWARPLAIVAAFLSIIKLPFGTALAVYTLWVLLPGASGREYEQMAVS